MLPERCLCSACVPTSSASVCSRCGEEVRHGIRDGVTGHLHRGPVDHVTVLGHTMTRGEKAEIAFQMSLERTRPVIRKRMVEGVEQAEILEETYSVETVDLLRHRKDKKFLANEEAARDDDEDDEDEVPIPAPERMRYDIAVDELPARSGVRQVANLILKTPDWELRRLTGARGPYLNSKGQCAAICDTVVVGARGPLDVDGSRPIAVGLWRDGKFDHAYTGTLRDGQLATDRANATELKNWIKRER